METILEPKRRQNTSCDHCRKRKVKCDARLRDPGMPCQHCSDVGTTCTFSKIASSVKPLSVDKRMEEPPMPGVLSNHGSESFWDLIDDSRAPKRKRDITQAVSLGTLARTEPVGGDKLGSRGIDVNASKASLVPPLPEILTSTTNGRTELAPPTLERDLLNRYFEDVSGNMPWFGSDDVLQRYQYGDHPSHPDLQPLPPYVVPLLTSIEARTSDYSEIQVWAVQAWMAAYDMVKKFMLVGQPSITLAQALVTLGSSWLGDLESFERISVWDTALRLIYHLRLHLSETYEPPKPCEDAGSARLFFWKAYVLDTYIALGTGRPLLITDDSHDVRMLIPEDLVSRTAEQSMPLSAQLICFRLSLHVEFARLAREIIASLCTTRARRLPLKEILQRTTAAFENLEQCKKKHRDILLAQLKDLSDDEPLRIDLTSNIRKCYLIIALKVFSAPVLGELHSIKQALRAANLQSEVAASFMPEVQIWLERSIGCVRAILDFVNSPKSQKSAFGNQIQRKKGLIHDGTYSRVALVMALHYMFSLSQSWSKWDDGNGLLALKPFDLGIHPLTHVDHEELPLTRTYHDLLEDMQTAASQLDDGEISADRLKAMKLTALHGENVSKARKKEAQEKDDSHSFLSDDSPQSGTFSVVNFWDVSNNALQSSLSYPPLNDKDIYELFKSLPSSIDIASSLDPDAPATDADLDTDWLTQLDLLPS